MNRAKNRDFEKNLKLGVLFLNLGGPERMEDVEGFLYNLFADPDIIRLPPYLSAFQNLIALIISKRRVGKSSEAYKSIGGGSPIVKYTQAQSDLIQETLRSRGFLKTKCYFAMRYWHPYTEDTLERIKEDGVNTLVIVPLYPQYSISTSGSSLKLLQDIFYTSPQVWGPEKIVHTVVPSWYHRPGYIKVMAKLIMNELKQYSSNDFQDGIHVLYSAHGVPESYIAAGDPYKKQIEECVRLVSKEVTKQLLSISDRPIEIPAHIASQLAGKRSRPSLTSSSSASRIIDSDSDNIDESYRVDDVLQQAESYFTDNDRSTSTMDSSNQVTATKQIEFHLSFQSRVGPVKWLSPYTEEMISYLGKDKGVKNLIVVPVSFVSEHIETLEEIDMEYRELAEECGIINWKRAPALNTDASFIEDMADLVIEALEAPTLSVAEAASSSYADVISMFPPSDALSELRRGSEVERMPYSVMGDDIDGDDLLVNSSVSKEQLKLSARESLTGIITMAGLIGTTFLEFFNHHPVMNILGFK